jgi:hypothetical protein
MQVHWSPKYYTVPHTGVSTPFALPWRPPLRWLPFGNTNVTQVKSL